MREDRARQWVEGYLYGARGHRALEQSVFAEGERHGFSERKLRHTAQTLGVSVTGGCWELSALRAAALDARTLLAVDEPPAPSTLRRRLPSVGQIDFNAPLRVRRAA